MVTPCFTSVPESLAPHFLQRAGLVGFVLASGRGTLFTG